MIRVSEPTIDYNEENNVLRALGNNQLSGGEFVRTFEKLIAKRCGTKYAVATSSGTTALHLALVALGIGPGDEVIVPDYTFVATANAVKYTGAEVRLADVLPDTWTISPEEIANKTRFRTKTVIPVHLYGRDANINEPNMIEDSAEVFGKPLAGISAIFSFYGNKIITTGEGGAVITNNEAYYERLMHLRGQAMTTRYNHDEVGFNYRMAELQGAIGCSQVMKVDKLIKRRAEINDLYAMHLPEEAVMQDGEIIVNWITAVRVKERDRIMRELEKRGIETRPGFVPLHKMPMYACEDKFPVSNKLGDEVLCLPTHANLTDENVIYVCQMLKELI